MKQKMLYYAKFILRNQFRSFPFLSLKKCIDMKNKENISNYSSQNIHIQCFKKLYDDSLTGTGTCCFGLISYNWYDIKKAHLLSKNYWSPYC